ncbi:response regulator transcription factor [Phytohabitans flavus]|uniref:response regulator transcription factor n=1 Tax=Phytohabitans flavus TaxID=1076124 RepID=UPI00156331F3|nr:response regulator transcription factor [Phytohabitans flavus]
MVVHPDPHDGAAIRAALGTSRRLRVLGVTGDGDEALALARRLRPTVSLLDDRVLTSGTDLVAALARWTLVIALTGATERGAIVTLLQAPVQGCLTYGYIEPPDLVRAVHAVADGLGWLSPAAAAAVTWAMREATPLPARPDHPSSHLELP